MTQTQQAETEGTGKPQENPVDRAAYDFSTEMPRFKELLGQVSQKGAVRVLKMLVAYPLETTTFQHPAESELFALGNHLLACKSLMIAHTLAEVEEKKRLAEEGQKGETDGKEQQEKVD